MFKITAIVSLMLIAAWSQADSRRHKKEATASSDYDQGSTLWAASLSCDSCGSECTSACGTRHFRSCCFNYLRKKRGPDTMKLWTPNMPEKPDNSQKNKLPFYIVENIPESWGGFVSNEYKPLSDDDRVQVVYDI